MMNKNEKKESRFERFKPYINVGVTGLIELFTHAVYTTVMGNVEGSKLAKFGARIGVSLIGLMVGDQVTDYLCDSADEFMDSLDEAKEAIEEAGKG